MLDEESIDIPDAPEETERSGYGRRVVRRSGSQDEWEERRAKAGTYSFPTSKSR